MTKEEPETNIASCSPAAKVAREFCRGAEKEDRDCGKRRPTIGGADQCCGA